MPRDYARYVSKTKRPLIERGWRKRLLLVGFLLILLTSVAYSIYLYQYNTTEDASSSIKLWVKQAKGLFVKAPIDPDTLSQAIDQSEPMDAQQDAEIQFNFYSDLATMQVSAPQIPGSQVLAEDKTTFAVEKKLVEVEKPVVSSADQTKVVPEKYLLQIAAFKNPTAAGEMRISLLLAGFEAEIVKAMQNDQQLYQLQQGPFSSIAEAKAMQRELKKKDIESVIVKKVT